jgi:hypothetical protein
MLEGCAERWSPSLDHPNLHYYCGLPQYSEDAIVLPGRFVACGDVAVVLRGVYMAF